MSSNFFVKSSSHSFINFLNNRSFVELFTHRPSFFITKLAVGALIIKVKKAHPEVLNSEAVLNVALREVFEARISVKAIPTAPLKPP